MKNLIPLLFLLSFSAYGQECIMYESEPQIGKSVIAPLDCDTFKVAVHIIYSEFNGNEWANPTDEQSESAIRGANEAFLNEGHTYHEYGTVLPYTLKLDAITHTNGVEVFGDEYQTCGIRVNATTCGVSVSNIFNYFEGIGYDRDEYINIYIYNKRGSSTTTGFAWLANPRNGVFVRYDRWGDSFYEDEYEQDFPGNPNNTTFVHECGHMFGLFHTHNATTSCESETNPAIQGDRVLDTPVETLTYGCALKCGENSRNYMSYRSCKDAFTAGQVERMQLAIQNSFNHFNNYVVCDDCNPALDGDFDGSGAMNIIDVSLLVLHFGCSYPSICYDSLYDFNCDGYINIIDVSYFVTVFDPVMSEQEFMGMFISGYKNLRYQDVKWDAKGFIVIQYNDGTTETIFNN